MRLWQKLQCWARPLLCQRRVSHAKTQWNKRYHSIPSHGSMQWSVCWTKFTTCERWPTQRRLSEQPRGRKTGHIGQWCLGGQISKNLLRRKSIQPARPLQQKPAPSSNLQKTWTGKETGISTKNPGSRTLLFHTFSAICYRRHGCRSNTLLQTPQLTTRPEMGHHLQQNTVLVKVSPNLLPLTLGHSSNQRCKIVSGTRSKDSNWDSLIAAESHLTMNGQ